MDIIIIEEIKLSGKKKMDSKSLLNGYTFSEMLKCFKPFIDKDFRVF